MSVYKPFDDSVGSISKDTSYADDDTISLRSMSSRASKLRRKVNKKSLSEPLTEEKSVDPFYVFRDDLYRKLELVDEGLAEYLRVVHETDSAVNKHELKDVKKQLKRRIKGAESTLKDVHMTVQLVADCSQEDRIEKFSHITETELYDRKSFVSTSRDRIRRAKDEMSSEAVKAKLLADERSKALRRAAGEGNLGATSAAQRENTGYIADTQARTSLLMQHQDETLDELDVAVVRVGAIAENIHDEIGQQNKMLDEMEDDLAKVEEELGLVMGKLGKFLKTRDKWQLRTILMLFFIMVVLLMLVLYT